MDGSIRGFGRLLRRRGRSGTLYHGGCALSGEGRLAARATRNKGPACKQVTVRLPKVFDRANSSELKDRHEESTAKSLHLAPS
jgi:hypothetical protein